MTSKENGGQVSRGDRSRVRIARNFINRYGAKGLDRLIAALSNGESGQSIAEEFNVSRERVRQWKNAFGQVMTLYQVYPEIETLLKVDKPLAELSTAAEPEGDDMLAQIVESIRKS
jgi:hypothetical protein